MPNDMLPRLGNIPTPLEVVDSALDNVAELVQLPFRAGKNVSTATAGAFGGVKSALDRPKEYAEVPAPPDVVVRGALEGVASIGGGVVEAVTGVFGAVKETGDGVKRHVDDLIKR